MRTLLVVALLVLSNVAVAQPGPQDPQPQPYPQPPPPAYGYQPRPVMQVQLTLDEQYLLERGYISDEQMLVGTAAAFFLGFGIGHAVEGRYMQRGYLFTIGDVAALGVMTYGMIQMFNCIGAESCTNGEEDRAIGWMMVGAIGGLVVRTWEIIDAATGPGAHNRKLRALHMRLGMQPMYTRLSPYVTTPRDSGGAVAGVSLRF